MIQLVNGDILESKAEALVNTVNCAGVMGRGIALQFKKTYPENYKFYKKTCDLKQLSVGQMLVYRTGQLNFPHYIINFPTKRHWKGKSLIADIQAGLAALIKEVESLQIGSIAIPPLGCGLGGLDWNVVKPIIEQACSKIPNVKVFLHEPTGVRHQQINSPKVPPLSEGRKILLGLIQKYSLVAMDWVSLLEIHKLMYLMQEAGQDLKLRYEKGTFGPFANNLRHVLASIEGHYITGYSDASDSPAMQIQLTEKGREAIKEFLKQKNHTTEKFDRVVNVINGFETSYGMELLTTVHWIARHDKAESIESAIELTHKWNIRKQMFGKDEIKIAWEILKANDWI